METELAPMRFSSIPYFLGYQVYGVGQEFVHPGFPGGYRNNLAPICICSKAKVGSLHSLFSYPVHSLGVPITWGHDTEKAQSCGVDLNKKAKHPRQSAPQSRMSLCVPAASRVVEPVEYQ